MERKPDFSGYATKNDLKCSDGRTIKSGAFKHQHKVKVPLVWQHQSNDHQNILGHAILEDRTDGVYAYGFFNKTATGKNAKALVQHGDISALSIWANKLKQKAGDVLHGAIREVSLVLTGANPGAFIDYVNLAHSDGEDDEAIIYTGLPHEHSDLPDSLEDEEDPDEDELEDVEENLDEELDDIEPSEPVVQHKDQGDKNMATDTKETDDKTVKDVFETLNEEQKNVVYFMIGEALEEAGAKHSDEDEDDDDNSLAHASYEEGFNMARNVFEQNGVAPEGQTLSHAQMEDIVKDAQKVGSFKDAFLAHADEYGIEDIDFLFPDAKNINNTPQFISRRMEWVSDVMTGTKHSPFSRVKSIVADITADEARAKGYVKGTMKKDEVIKLLRRITNPTTIYKKQKLDRDDMLDITDLDVVAFLKAEMRLMLEEEIARAILLGDGREYGDEDKIDEEAIRPIAKDHTMYSHSVTLTSNADTKDQIEALIRARANYRGTGAPVFFTTQPFLVDMLLDKDKMGRRLYESQAALASALMVSKIVTVEAMEQEADIVGIMVNLADYTIGADKGGELGMFDDFDIDFNQHKYLIETRISGALTKPKSAVIIKRAEGTLVTPVSPSFDGDTNTITFPATAGVIYQIEGIPFEGTEVITETTDVTAVADTGYSFPHGSITNWTFSFSG